MNSSDNEAKCFSFKEISPFSAYLSPISITVSGIHRAVLEDDLKVVKCLVEAEESVNVGEEEYGYTPLHLAVIRNGVGVLDYLLSRDDIQVNQKGNKGFTPVHTASDLGAYESVKKLIDAGADVNIPDDDDTSPLHHSVWFPDVTHLLIQNGANVNAVDYYKCTPLHFAVDCQDSEAEVEVTHMLLYYNADPNVRDYEDRTPLMHAISSGKIEIQRCLLDYVLDFNEVYCYENYYSNLLGMALQSGSPFVKEMIDRGADVNYGNVPGYGMGGECAFEDCLSGGDETAFKMVWERLCCYRKRRPIDLCELFELHQSFVANAIQVIIESDNLGVAVHSFTSNNNFSSFVRKFISSGLEMDQLIVLTYRLLEYGYRPTLKDVRTIFSKYEPCELLRILLYMDVDLGDIYVPETKTYLRAMFDLDFDAVVLADKYDSRKCKLTRNQLISVLEYFHDPYLVNFLHLKFSDNESVSEILNGLPKVPSLVELARDETRKHIRKRFRITNTCQFYTILDRLDIPSIYKSVITYSRKIYRVKH